MSVLKLIAAEFKHLSERSVYNHNYYRNEKGNYIVLEECNEYAGSYEFYLIEFDKEILLGSSQQGLGEIGIEEVFIDFRVEYT